jgi:hypothetical protein
VDRLGGVILGEGLWLSLMTLGTFLREKSLGSVAGGLKLSVRHAAVYLMIQIFILILIMMMKNI